jgi:hypothetical protein
VLGSYFRKAFLSEIIPDRNQACRWSLSFVSPVPDPRAYAVDAMSLSWERIFAYEFPPFRFLVPVLHKITGEKCRIIVIAPAWPKQAWFDCLMKFPLCIDWY